jgi:hypothetical protein
MDIGLLQDEKLLCHNSRIREGKEDSALKIS